MKVLMINHFPLEGSGSGTYTKNIARHLAELGHEVCVIMPENETDFPEVEGVRLHPVYFTGANGGPSGALPFNFPCFTSHPRSVETFDGLSDEKLEMYKDAFRAAIDEEITEHRPDIIHGQHVWILPALATGDSVPLVLTAHGTDLMGYDKWPRFREYADCAMKESARVIAISKDNAELVRRTFPDHAQKIRMMRNGYDPSVFYPDDVDRKALIESYGIEYCGERVVLFAGKLAHFKGVDVLLDAAAIYEKDKEKTITLIAGDGDENDMLRKKAQDLDLKTVHFLGNVNQEMLRKLYSIADIDLVPSRREPFGLVAIEAMACGTPVIASNQGGLPDFVNESVGALTEPENAEDLAAAVVKTLARCSDTWRREIAEYAKEHYSQRQIIKELETLYKEVLAEDN